MKLKVKFRFSPCSFPFAKAGDISQIKQKARETLVMAIFWRFPLSMFIPATHKRVKFDLLLLMLQDIISLMLIKF